MEEYKELYYKEIEYTEGLNSKINTCMTYFSNYTDTDINVNNCQCCGGGKKMANNKDEVKLTQTTINGIPLPQTPKAELLHDISTS